RAAPARRQAAPAIRRRSATGPRQTGSKSTAKKWRLPAESEWAAPSACSFLGCSQVVNVVRLQGLIRALNEHERKRLQAEVDHNRRQDERLGQGIGGVRAKHGLSFGHNGQASPRERGRRKDQQIRSVG